MSGRTIAEQILSRAAHRDAQAGDLVVCDVDLVLGTDASAPMAISYFEQMGGRELFDPAKVMFALDHYAPPTSASTLGFHSRVRAFASKTGATVFEVGEGISHQVIVERGLVRSGALIVGADSHTVSCGALNTFAIGVGSSDLAAAFVTGRVWLRVPESIRVVLTGVRRAGVSAKDIALELVSRLGADGANYQALEFTGSALGALSLNDGLVLCNLAVETGAKAAMFPPATGVIDSTAGVTADETASYAREVVLDLGDVTERVALPHSPGNVVALGDATGIPVHMVFIGTCAGGRVEDVHDALTAIDAAGGQVAPGVTLVVTPASRVVHEELARDGSLARLNALGATVTVPGCGACCGTSGVIPSDNTTVLSSANRNFKSRMGNASVSIYLASPAVCGRAAATGMISSPIERG